MVKFRYSSHALLEMERRKIDRSITDSVISAPVQKVLEHSDVICYQSKISMDGCPYLVRVMVNESKVPYLIVTVYRTSKIEKYWRKDESDL
jgi:hypothetical protein